MAAVAAPKRVRISEAYAFAPSPLRVDREGGCVYGVKVLGFTSTNKRRYAREAVAKAVKSGLYEGAKVYVDHPAQPGKSRPAEQLLGRLKKSRLAEDGVHANLHVNTAHPMATRVFEDCEKGLGLYGLSHNAEAGDYHFDSGVQVVTEIVSVESVDLVSDPATNTNLWEGRKVPIPLKQWLEERTTDKALPAKTRKLIFEMYGAMPEDDDTVMADEPGAADGRQLLAQAVAALVQSADASDHELAQKVLRLLKPAEGGGGDDEVTESDDDEDDGVEHKPKEGKKPRKAPALAVLTEAEARDLCLLADVQVTAALLEGLTGLPEANARKVLLSHKHQAQQARRGQGPPRSASGHVHESNPGTVPADRQKALEWLRE